MDKKLKEKQVLAREEKVRQRTLRILRISTGLFLLAALLAFPPAMSAIRMFDAHGATENPATILLFLCFFSFPAVLLCSLILAWLMYVLEIYRRVRWFLLLPVINLLGSGIGLAWLQIAYDGLFGGKR